MQRNESIAKRFQKPDSQAPTVLESAIELSEKYATLSEQAATLRQQIQSEITKNQQLSDQIATLEAQLQQAQEELTEANNLLIEMRIELNNWKGNIIGFREEMREAQTVQLEALFKILKLLGGQVDVESATAQNVGPDVASQSHFDGP